MIHQWLVGLSAKHGKSEILYAASMEPCGRNGWHVQGDGMSEFISSYYLHVQSHFCKTQFSHPILSYAPVAGQSAH